MTAGCCSDHRSQSEAVYFAQTLIRVKIFVEMLRFYLTKDGAYVPARYLILPCSSETGHQSPAANPWFSDALGGATPRERIALPCFRRDNRERRRTQRRQIGHCWQSVLAGRPAENLGKSSPWCPLLAPLSSTVPARKGAEPRRSPGRLMRQLGIMGLRGGGWSTGIEPSLGRKSLIII